MLITYLKDSDLKNEIPLCKDYLIDLRSKYKKDQNDFIKNVVRLYEDLHKKGEITSLLFLNLYCTKLNKKDVEQFKVVKPITSE